MERRGGAALIAGTAGIGTLLAVLAGCGALDPYPTMPVAASPGTPVGPRVAICYNPLNTSEPEAQAQAQQECAADRTAQPVDTDFYMQNCPLLLPARASFVCAKK